MGALVTNLLSGGLLQGVSGLINTIRGRSPEDAAALAQLAAKYQSEILAADTAQAQAQAAVNQAEASNPNIFVAGWRPFIGWVCGLGLLSQFIVAPFATWVAGLFGKPIVFPSLDLGTLLTLLLGMLGLGAMRSYDKTNGVGSGH